MKHRIVVLGAGYAGATTAGRLAKRLHRDDVEITLVSADADFVERVRMHQLAAGQDLRQRPLRELFAGTGVRVVTARVTAVDVDRKLVQLADSEPLAYDSLVYALGSTGATDVPGVVEYAHSVAGKQAALHLRARLNTLTPGATVLVVGGGLTAIEAATEIAEAHPDLAVTIVARGGVGDWLHEKAQRHLRTVFERLGITVRTDTEITRVTENGVITGAATELDADVTVWTAGFAVHPIAAASTLTVSETGRIVVDITMRSVSHPEVYAVGDAAQAPGPDGRPLRMSCAAGTPMGWRAADAIAARLTGSTVPEDAIGYAAQCISLGRRDAVFQRVSFADEPTSTVLTGRLGARVKEFICAGAAWGVGHPTVLMPTRRRRIVAADAREDRVAAR
ncbi:NAD(P)/FAD-dependent oxidoreductase [Nocardia neocaledoniensis]|uniref:NAD(P)/FAD-dependent oxidoreductase n=1 Tax=Nocardia neocaledoniensis TaxID=236511 RepID=UPI00245864D5|nr:FAD-dependent oxidoreductase [Nocardia neocaledoniensis]